MLLYLDTKRAPNPRKVRIYLAEKNLDIPVKEIDLYAGEQKTPEFLAKNPFAGVPILELDDGTVLIETLPIMEYLEELCPDPPLIGTDPVSRALVRSWERRCENRSVSDGLAHGAVQRRRVRPGPPSPDAPPAAGQRRPGRQGLAGREFFDCRHHAVYRPGDCASSRNVSA